MPIAPIYATLADYRAWVDDETATVSDRLLRQASRIIDDVLFGAVYTVDPLTDKATDTAIAQAITDATCAQAEWMEGAGDTTGLGDVVKVKSASIGSVSYTDQQSQAAGVTTDGAEVAPSVVRELRGAGLRTVVFVHG